MIKKILRKLGGVERRAGKDRRKKIRRARKPSEGTLPKPHFSRVSHERRKRERRAN